MFRQKEMPRKTGKWVALLMFAVLSGCFQAEGEDQLDLFVYNAADGIQSLDPARAVDLESLWVVDQLYEGLLELDTALNVVPALASEWSVSGGGTVYSFKLRSGVNFHDGSPLTADDVVLSFQRMLDPAQALPGRWVLNGLLEEGGVTAMGEDSVVLNLEAPNPVFASLLATPQASILKGGGIGVNAQALDLGTGPFMLKGWLPETAMVLHRNPEYWMQHADGRRLPFLRGIRIEFNREEGAEMLGFSQGRYDFVSAPRPEWMEVFFDDDGHWNSEWEGRFKRYSVPFLKTDYIGILSDSASCADIGTAPILPEVRRAMSMALDRQLLVNELRAGGASIALGFVPHGMPGFSQLERPGHASLVHDPIAAKELLAQVGVGPEPPLARLSAGVLGTKPATAELAAALQHTWDTFGIDVVIDVAPSGIDAERVAQSEVSLFRKSWLADYPDAENFLGLFDRSRWTPAGPNYTRYADAVSDSLLRMASTLPPGEERNEVLRNMERRVLDEMPVIPLWHDDVIHLVGSEWTGWRATSNNRLDLRFVERRAEVEQ